MNLFAKKTFLVENLRQLFVVLILLSFVHNFIVFPVHAAADENAYTPAVIGRATIIKKANSVEKHFEQISSAQTTQNKEEIDFTLITPINSEKTNNSSITHRAVQTAFSGHERVVTLTAYNSERAQTDGDPCTTANGFNVCNHGIEDTVAANFLPLGTEIQIPEYFGDRVFVVRDRTARKYGDRVDVWMLKKSDAMQFGKRRLKIIVVS